MAMPRKDVSTTIPHRAAGRDSARAGVLLFVGSGTSLDSGRMVAIEGGVDVGRHPPPVTGRVAVELPERTVSSLHARVDDGDEGFFVEDCGSTNGTMVDGAPVVGRVPLREGAVLFFGAQVALFRTVTASEAAAITAEQRAPLAPVPTLCPSLAATCFKLRRLARSAAEIMLLGETGVGKEVFARSVHEQSGREGPFLAINCAALPRELVESELFGYERGAHSSAKTRKAGLIEAADGGTLFLDELGEMSLEAQSKLLRFLQDRTYFPIGATRPLVADVRVIAASSRPPGQAGALGIQEALLGRLGAQPVELPPLHERLEDLGRLVSHFLSHSGVPGRQLEPNAFQALFFYHWPHNVRELQKVIVEAQLLCDEGEAIGLQHLPAAIAGALERVETDGGARGSAASPATRPAAAAGAEGQPTDGGARARRTPPTATELHALMQQYRGNVTHVARHLDRQWTVVWRWLRRHQIDPHAYRGAGDATDDPDSDPEPVA